MDKTLKYKIFSGVFWQGIERVGTQGIWFVLSILLARLIAPEEFGVIAIIGVFTNLCGVFIDAGLSSALIQKKDLQESDCCSVFYINIAAALALYVILFFAAPFIAEFYNKPAITVYLRVMALGMVVGSISGIQGTLLNRKMLFYLNFRISWSALLVSGTIGVIMALRGFGVWALIMQQLTGGMVRCVLLWHFVKWHPQRLFDWQRTRELFSFGWKMFVSGILDTLYNNIYNIIIGRLFNLTTLSYYNRGSNVPNTGMTMINSTLGGVLFPAFSEIQDDRERMRRLAVKSLKIIMFFVIPVLAVLCALAEPIVLVMLTDKWLPCIIFMQISCLSLLFWPFHTLNLQIITACGRSDIFLILEIIKKVQLCVIILIFYRHGVVAMTWGLVISGASCVIVNAWPCGKLIGYPPWRQFADVTPLLLIAAVSGTAVWYLSRCIPSSWGKLSAGGAVFGILYLSGTYIFHLIPDDIIQIIKKRSLA